MDAFLHRIKDACQLHGQFTLRSGAVSDVYFDKYRFEADPHLLTQVAARLAELLPADTEILAGVELGGVPLATAMAIATGLPVRFVRKVAKPYGTMQLAEGGDIAQRRLTIVEDVVSTGGQIIESAEGLRAAGATVSDVVCVILRDAVAVENLAAAGLTLHPVTTQAALEALNATDRLA